MNFDAVYTVKKEFGKEEFLRELIIELGLNTGTPVDVVDAEFKDVKEVNPGFFANNTIEKAYIQYKKVKYIYTFVNLISV